MENWRNTYHNSGVPVQRDQAETRFGRAARAVMVGMIVVAGCRSLITALTEHTPKTTSLPPIAWCSPGHTMEVDPALITVLGRQEVIEPVLSRKVNGRPVYVSAVINETLVAVTGVDETTAPHSSNPTLNALLRAVQPKITCKVVDRDLAAVLPGTPSPYETNFSQAAQFTPCQTGHQMDQLLPRADPRLHAAEDGITTTCE